MSFEGLGATEGGGNTEGQGRAAVKQWGWRHASYQRVIPGKWSVAIKRQFAINVYTPTRLRSGRIQGLSATPEKKQTFLFIARWPLTVCLERPLILAERRIVYF